MVEAELGGSETEKESIEECGERMCSGRSGSRAAVGLDGFLVLLMTG